MNAKTDEEDLKKVVDHESEFDDSDDRDDDDEDQERDEKENEDERLTGKTEEDGGESSEMSEEDKEREALRAKRREERKHRKEAAKERENTLRRELSARDEIIDRLNQRLSAIEQRGAGNEVAQIDSALNQLASAYVEAKQNLEKGTNEQDGRIVVEATERMQTIRAKAEQLSAIKNQIVAKSKAPRPDQLSVDPRLKNYAESWIQANPWYKQGGTDDDSRTVSAIDDSLAAEGWNPTTPEYWNELTRRVKKELPKRFETSYNGKQQRSVVSGSSRTASNASRSSYTLSPERVEAMKEAGAWDDPKKREKMIEAYKKYDKENARG